MLTLTHWTSYGEIYLGFPREEADRALAAHLPSAPALMDFGPTDHLPEKHVPVAVATEVTKMALGLNQPPASWRCRENLEGNRVRGKSQKSTEERLPVLVLMEKFSKQ